MKKSLHDDNPLENLKISLDEDYYSPLLSLKFQHPSEAIQESLRNNIIMNPKLIFLIDPIRDWQLLIEYTKLQYNLLIVFPQLGREWEIASYMILDSYALSASNGGFINVICKYVLSTENDLFHSTSFISMLINSKKEIAYIVKEKIVELMSEELKRDGELILNMIPQFPVTKIIRQYHGNDRQVIMRALEMRVSVLHAVSISMRRDWNILSMAVQNDISEMLYCENVDFIKYMIEKDGMNIWHAANQFKRDPNLVLLAVTHNEDGKLLAQYCNEFESTQEIRSNRPIIMESVRRDGMNLQYASKELSNDPEIVELAVQQCCFSFRFAGEDIKKNTGFVSELLDRYCLIFEYCSDNIKKDKDLNLKVLKKRGNLYKFSGLKQDFDVAMTAIKQNGFVLYQLSEEFKNCKEIVMEAVKNRGTALQYASDELKRDRQVVLAAINQNGQSFKYADSSLQLDRELIQQALNNKCPKCFINKEMRSEIENWNTTP